MGLFHLPNDIIMNLPVV